MNGIDLKQDLPAYTFADQKYYISRLRPARGILIDLLPVFDKLLEIRESFGSAASTKAYVQKKRDERAEDLKAVKDWLLEKDPCDEFPIETEEEEEARRREGEKLEAKRGWVLAKVLGSGAFGTAFLYVQQDYRGIIVDVSILYRVGASNANQFRK